ncbi:MAG: hypothetical protein ACXAES_08625 [Promethearchaeota archaeon]
MEFEGNDLVQRSPKNKIYWIIGITAAAALLTFIIVATSLNLFNIPSGGS